MNGTDTTQGIATQSYSNNSETAGVYAFDNTINMNSHWATHGAPAATTPSYGAGQWLQFDVGDNRKHISMYRMWARAHTGTAAQQFDYAQYLPTDWRIEGSNDDINWTILDTRTGINNDALAHGLDSSVVGLLNIPYSEYKMQNPGKYRYYRLYVVSTNRLYGVLIGELAYYPDSRTNIYEYNVENLNNKWLHLVNTFSPDYIPRLWINNTEIMGNATLTQHNDTTINDDEEDLVALKFGLCDAKDCAFSYDATGFIFHGGQVIDLGNKFDVTSANILGNNSRTIITTINVNNITASGYVWSYGNHGAYELFGLKLTSVSGTYRLYIIVWDYDWETDVYIQEQVETTIAVSYDGPSKTAYLFIKNPNTGLWEIKSHTFSSEINTTLGTGFTLGALVTNTSASGHYLSFFKGEIGQVIVYNHSVTNANFYGENAKLLDAPSYNSMPWNWAESFSSGFSRIRNVNILNGYSADSNAVKQLYENAEQERLSSSLNIFTNKTDLVNAVNLWIDDNQSALEYYGPINEWDVSAITDMSQLFKDKITFNDNISSWDVSNVTNMQQMFSCWPQIGIFNQDIGGWNVSKVTRMDEMLTDQQNFNQNLNNWDVSKVTTMYGIFIRCLPFNHPLDNWDVSNVTDMKHMFHTCQVFNQDISGWNVSNVTNIEAMFFSTLQFDQDISNWNLPTTNVNYEDYGLSSGHPDVEFFANSSVYYFKVNHYQFGQNLVTNGTFSQHKTITGTEVSWGLLTVTEIEDWDFSYNGIHAILYPEGLPDWNNPSLISNHYIEKYFLGLQGNSASISQTIEVPVSNTSTTYSLSFLAAVRDNWWVGGGGSPDNIQFKVELFDSNEASVSDETYLHSASFNTFKKYTKQFSGLTRGQQYKFTITNDYLNGAGANVNYGDQTIFIANVEFFDSFHDSSTTSEANSQLETAISNWIADSSGAINTYGPINTWKTNLVSRMSNLFHNESSFNEDISNWDVSNVTAMNGMFRNADSFNQPLNSWDVSNVINLSHMFRDANLFNQPLNSWDVSICENMSYMFSNADSFNQPLNDWNVSKVKYFEVMFNSANYFNQPLSNWNTISAITMKDMFRYTPFFNQDISNWDVSNVTAMNGMFRNADDFNQPLNNWNVSKVTTMYEMFQSAKAFNQDISNWNIENVADWENFGTSATAAITEFQNITDTSGTNKWNYFKYKFGNNLIKNSNLNGWDVTEATTGDNGPIWGYMGPEYLFDWSFNWGHNIVYNNEDGLNAWNNPSGLNINIPYFVALQNHGTYIRQTINITTTGAYTLTFLCARREPTAMSPPQDNVDIKIELTSTSTSNSEVIHTLSSTVFESFSTHYDINTTGDYTLTIYNNIGDASGGTADVFIANVEFFNGTTASSDLVAAVGDWIADSTTAEATYGHISKWDVSYVTNMYWLFKGTSFNENISGWNTSNVTTMEGMFNSTPFNQPLNNWDVSSVTTMEDMFKYGESFDQPLNNWDVSNVTSMQSMFYQAKAFNQPLNDWNVSSVTTMVSMFRIANSFNQPIDSWNVSSVTNLQAFISGTGSPNNDFNQDISNWNLPTPTSDVNYTNYGSNGNHSDSLFTDSSVYYFKVNRTPLTNSNIQTAVDAWIADSSSTPEYGGHISNWDVSYVTNMDELFKHKSSFNENISNWDVSNVTSMYQMFNDADSFNQPLNNWNVSSVTTMQGMFKYTLIFDQPLDNWDVSNVTSMQSMFFQASAFNQPLNNWNVSNVTSVNNMFQDALAFNQDISDWSATSWVIDFSAYVGQSVEDAQSDLNSNFSSLSPQFLAGAAKDQATSSNSAFEYQTGYYTADAGGINFWGHIEGANTPAIFRCIADANGTCRLVYGCLWANESVKVYVNGSLHSETTSTSATATINVSTDDVIEITESNSVIALYSITFKAFSINTTFGQGSGHTNTLFWNGYETSPYYLKVNRSPINDTNIQTLVDNWVGSDTTSTEVILYSEGQAGYGGIGNNWWNASAVSGTFTDYQSAGAKILTLSGVSHTYFIWNSAGQLYSLETGANPVRFVNNSFNTYTFKGAHYGVAPPQYGGHISTWDVSQVTNMFELFRNKSSFNEDISGWDVSNVTTMVKMFRDASSFNQPLNNFDVSNVTTLNSMLRGSAFNQPLDNWNVSKVTNMNNLFNGLSSFDQSINNWDVSQVTEMDAMFVGATSFNQPLNDWNVSGLTRMWSMFIGATSFNQNISGWDVSNILDHGSFGQGTSSMPTEFQNSNLYGYFNYTFGTDLINNSRFSDSTGGIEQVWGNMSVSNIRGWEVSNGVNVVENTVDGLNAWNNPSGLKRTFIGTPPPTITFHTTGNWLGTFYWSKKTGATATSVSYEIFSTSSNSLFGPQHGATFTFNTSDELELDINGIGGGATPDTFKINGGTETSGPHVIAANDDIELLRSDNGSTEAHFTVPSEFAVPNFVALQGHSAYIRQTINITTTGTYTLTFLCARRDPEAMSVYNYFVPILIELTSQTSVTHKLSSSVFESFSTDYVINATGDFTLTIFNAIGSDEKGTADVFIADVKFRDASDARTELDTAITAWVTDSTAATATYGHISNWNVSNVTNMEELFKDKSSFNENIGGWDVSNVTDMAAVFQNATSFNQDISGWNVSKVTRMTNMFRNTPFNQNISSWDVSSVTGMASMFRNADDFNQPLNNWDVSNVIEMHYMFWYAQSFNQSLNNWNVSNVVDMDKMFINAESYNQSLNDWNVSSVTNMTEMFKNATAFNQPLNTWNVSSVEDMSSMFSSATTFDKDLDSWNVSSVKDMKYMFQSASAFNRPIGSWNISNVTKTQDMFVNASSFNQDISGWDVSNVTYMSFMFSNTPFNNGGSTGINNWNVSSVTTLWGMFKNATSFNQDISGWDVSNVTTIRELFYNATSFNQDISSWDVSAVSDFHNYGEGASSHELPDPESGANFQDSLDTYFDVFS